MKPSQQRAAGGRQPTAQVLSQQAAEELPPGYGAASALPQRKSSGALPVPAGNSAAKRVPGSDAAQAAMRRHLGLQQPGAEPSVPAAAKSATLANASPSYAAVHGRPGDRPPGFSTEDYDPAPSVGRSGPPHPQHGVSSC